MGMGRAWFVPYAAYCIVLYGLSCHFMDGFLAESSCHLPSIVFAWKKAIGTLYIGSAFEFGGQLLRFETLCWALGLVSYSEQDDNYHTYGYNQFLCPEVLLFPNGKRNPVVKTPLSYTEIGFLICSVDNRSGFGPFLIKSSVLSFFVRCIFYWKYFLFLSFFRTFFGLFSC